MGSGCGARYDARWRASGGSYSEWPGQKLQAGAGHAPEWAPTALVMTSGSKDPQVDTGRWYGNCDVILSSHRVCEPDKLEAAT